MSVFSWLFGSKVEVEQKTFPQQELKDSAIQFRPDLVETLTKDHRKIVALYREVHEIFKQKHYTDLAEKLNEFKKELQNHVITENVQFYTYLEHSLRREPEQLEFIGKVHKEMNGIVHEVVQFVKKYERAHFNDKRQQEFIEDLEAIGELITQRVYLEEKQIYTLYKA